MGRACTFLTCNDLISSCGCPLAGGHLGNQLDAIGKRWRNYGESMGAPCNFASAGDYAARHLPFLYYDDVQSDAGRCRDHIVDFTAFVSDLQADPPELALIAPNLIDDMHSPFPAGATNYTNGDRWLAAQVPPILASPAYRRGGLLVIVWDEDDLSGALAADDPIPLLLLSPLAKQGGYESTAHADHYSLLATMEDGLGVPRLGRAAAATPLRDYFPAD
jgi:hypothetical protein